MITNFFPQSGPGILWPAFALLFCFSTPFHVQAQQCADLPIDESNFDHTSYLDTCGSNAKLMVSSSLSAGLSEYCGVYACSLSYYLTEDFPMNAEASLLTEGAWATAGMQSLSPSISEDRRSIHFDFEGELRGATTDPAFVLQLKFSGEVPGGIGLVADIDGIVQVDIIAPNKQRLGAVTGSFPHPNPTAGTLNWENTSDKPVRCQLYSLAGQHIANENCPGFGRLQWQLSDLPKGAYWMKVQADNGEALASHKIIIAR